MIATYEGTYQTKVEAQNAAFRLKLMGYKTLIKAKQNYKGGYTNYEVFSDA